MDGVRKYLYYILVGVISLIMLIFIPMLGSSAGLQWVLPTTTAGWIVYVICKLCSAGFNISLFHCFNKQGKLNVLNDQQYLEARKILKETGDQCMVKKARSPHQYHKDIYGKKGLTIFIMTLLGTIGLSQAILTFDLKEFIVQLIALILGVIMGVLQMKDTESYWTEEYLEFAKDYRIEMTRKNQPKTNLNDKGGINTLPQQEQLLNQGKTIGETHVYN